jgi:hypothetical protein
MTAQTVMARVLVSLTWERLGGIAWIKSEDVIGNLGLVGVVRGHSQVCCIFVVLGGWFPIAI